MTQDPRPPGAPLFRVPRRLLAFCRWIFEREQLLHLARETPPGPAGPTAFGWLASPDHLPTDVQPSHRGPGFFRWLFSADRLPHLAEAPRRRLDLFSWLVASEPLPLAEPASPARSRSLLKWLVAPESTPRLADVETSKEGSPHEP
jgi:hypothetical protein